MKIVRSTWVAEVQDVMITMELALWFNQGKNKNTIVRKCANKLKWKYSPEINMIVKSWSKSNEPYKAYDAFMTKAGL